MDKGDWIIAVAGGVIPVVGAASAIIMEKAANKYGHTFMKIGPTNLFLIGIIGAVQNLASVIFTLLYSMENDVKYNSKRFIITMVLGHALTAAALTALTALAAKVNLISARMTLFGAVALTATSLIGDLALTLALAFAMKKK